jgi:hypothetical protein
MLIIGDIKTAGIEEKAMYETPTKIKTRVWVSEGQAHEVGYHYGISRTLTRTVTVTGRDEISGWLTGTIKINGNEFPVFGVDEDDHVWDLDI